MKRLMKSLVRWDAQPALERSVRLYRAGHALAVLLSPFGLPLPWLMRLAGTDKHRPDWPRGHRYGPAYAEAFRRFRWRRVRMVEIGIGGAAEDIGGRSLLAWRAYFPFATILACDIRDRSALATPRVEILRLDQGEGVALQGLAAKGPFDIIVDDGSHLNAHQLLTFAALFDSLAEGGLYVVEDVQTSFWHRVVDGVDWGGAAFGQAAFSTTCMGHFLALAAHLNYAEFLDPGDADPMLLPMARRIRCIAFEHNLIFVTKGRNEALSNTVGAGDGPR